MDPPAMPAAAGQWDRRRGMPAGTVAAYARGDRVRPRGGHRTGPRPPPCGSAPRRNPGGHRSPGGPAAQRWSLTDHPGPQAGRPRTNPVVPVEHDGRRWLVAPYGPVSCGAQRLCAAGRVTLTRRRDTREYAIREAAPGRGRAHPQAIRPHRHSHPTVFLATKTPRRGLVTEADRHPVFEPLTPVDENRQTGQPAP